MLRTNASKLCGLVLVGVALMLMSGIASAQLPADTYFVSYFSNAHNEGGIDARVRMDNPGVANGANLCADVYVFDNDEELQECCGCALSPNDMRMFSIDKNLTNNPPGREKLTTGVIKVISSAPNPNSRWRCDPTGGNTLSNPTNDNIVPTPTIRAWATHLQTPFTTDGRTNAIVTTEEEFAESTLGTTELNTLQELCFGLLLNGSGRGLCSCGTGH
jgi:hypothetical protein